MGLLFRLAELLVVILPLAGVIIAAIKAFSANQRRSLESPDPARAGQPFNVAEAEAIRRRRNDFSQEGRQRIARAQSLLRMASDSAATTQERQHAYDLARKELDGLIVLPSATQARIERRISGEIDG